MGDRHTESLSAWGASSLLDLPAIHKAMVGKDDRAIMDLGRVAGAAESGAWKTHARAIGELQRRAKYADAAVKRIAKELGLSPSTAFELGAIDRRILLPRLLEEGDAATFEIREKRFYVLACKLAPVVRKSPLAILAIAEQARRENRRFSTRGLKERLGVKPEPDPVKGMASCIAKLSAVERRARQRYARSANDPLEELQKVEAGLEVLTALAEDLRARAEEAG